MSRFADLAAAGEALADRLIAEGVVRADLVLTPARRGVPVAAAVADRLGAPLDVLPTVRVGAPRTPEAGLGALVGDRAWIDDAAVRGTGTTDADLSAALAAAAADLAAVQSRWRVDRPLPQVTDRAVVLVDDGMASGVTARAAVDWLLAQGAGPVTVALPVAPAESLAMVSSMLRPGDRSVVLQRPLLFRSVAWAYSDFTAPDDDTVVAALRRLGGGTTPE